MSVLFDRGPDFAIQASQEAAGEIQRALARVELLLRGLSLIDATKASELRRDSVDFLALGADASQRTRANSSGDAAAIGTQHQQLEDAFGNRISDSEGAIMDILSAEPAGMSLDSIFTHLTDMNHNITKGNLSVRLHRMTRSGRVISPGRGIYALAPIERAQLGRR